MDLRFGLSRELIGYVKPDAEPRHTTDLAGLGGFHFTPSVEDIVGTLGDMVSKGATSVNPPAEVSPVKLFATGRTLIGIVLSL